jgi:hypothetical protein
VSEVSIGYTEPNPAPAAPTITTVPASPANDNSPRVKGTVGAGNPTQAKIFANGTCTGPPLDTGTVAELIGAGIPVPVPLPDNSTTTFSASVSNSGGDSPCSNQVTYVEDSAAPGAPTIAASNPASPSAELQPELTGTAEAGSTVEVFESANCSGPVEAQGPAATFAAPGLTVQVAGVGTFTFSARATDAVGNVSPCSAPFDYTVPAPATGGGPGGGGSGGVAGVSSAVCANLLTGTSARDKLSGTPGSDKLVGMGGRDLLKGFDGPDCIEGGAGADVIKGGPGDDDLKGGKGPDRVKAGAGNDLIDVQGGGRDIVICGSGSDRVLRDRLDRTRGCRS